MEKKSSGRNQLGTKELIGYALGAVPTGLMAFIFMFKYIEFFFDDLKLLPIYFIWGQVIYMIINAVNDPLLGQLSDNTNRARWGSRRLIYIKYGGPIWALSFILMWFPWSLDNQVIIFLHYTFTICLFDTFLTLVVLVWMALLPEMTADMDERNKANFISMLFGILGVAPFFFLIGTLDMMSIDFKMMMIVVAIISSICLVLVSVLCEERSEFQKDETFPLKKAIKETVKLKSFQIFMAYNFCSSFLTSLGLSYIFVYSLVLGDDPAIAMLGFILIFVFFGYGSQFLCVKLRPKWSMHAVILRFGLLRVVGTTFFFILMIIPGLEWMIWPGFMWNSFFGGYSVFTTGALMYLSVDEDEIKNGARREGMFLGINALFTKPAGSVAPIIATLILVSFGYVQGSTYQSPEALLGIKILFLVVPTIVTAISLAIYFFYPLKGEKLEELQRELTLIHEEKQKAV